MLVVSGLHWEGFPTKTELIDLGRPNIICDLPDYPFQNVGAGAVGYINAKGPTICGGTTRKRFATNECLILSSDHQWESLTNMTTSRKYPSVTQIGIEEVLIIGGEEDTGANLRSTEIVNSYGSEASEDLPFSILYHCTLKINRTTALITGGRPNRQFSSDATWFVDLFSFKISQGPRLQIGRESHGCTALNLGGKSYAAISGGSQWTGGLYNYRHLDTTEILDLQANNATWKPGKY